MLFCGWLADFSSLPETSSPLKNHRSSGGTCSCLLAGLDGLNFVIWSKVHDKFTSVSDVTEMNLMLFFFVESSRPLFLPPPPGCRFRPGKGTKKLVSFPAINLRFSGKFVCWMCVAFACPDVPPGECSEDLWIKTLRDDVNWCQMVYHFWFHRGFLKTMERGEVWLCGVKFSVKDK